MKRKLVLVEWVDAAGRAEWVAEHDMPLAHIQTVGWITHRGKDRLVIAGSVADSLSAAPLSQQTVIPLGCIKSIKRLR